MSAPPTSTSYQQQQQSTRHSDPPTSTPGRTHQIKHHHQQLQHFINRMLNRLGVPDKAARGISGIHGMMNGRSDLPIYMAHKWTARQLNFQGADENSDKFMCRILTAISEAERNCGRRFFKITRADGETQIMTSYDIDYIGDAALWGLLQAMNSAAWKHNPAKAITVELVDAAIARLPACVMKDKIEGEGSSDTDARTIKGIWTKVENLARNNLSRIVRAGGDPVREIGPVQAMLMGLAIKARKEMLDRDRAAAEAETMTHQVALIEASPAGMRSRENDSFGGEQGGQVVSPADRNPGQTGSESKTDMCDWALFWPDHGMPVFPLQWVYDGICSCARGSECKSPGKHPMTRRGLKEATTSRDQIYRWWQATPKANIGGVMGGTRRLLAVDVDPKNGGDVTLRRVVEKQGDGWLATLHHKTGSGGDHFIYFYPEDVELRNTVSLIGPGIDTRAEGGYIVLPPSTHFSGRSYLLADEREIAPAPEWLVALLTKPRARSLERAVEFHERDEDRWGGSIIPEHSRNDRVFKIGCAIWGAGKASDVDDLYRQLLEVHARCEQGVDPFTEREVREIAKSIVRYRRGVAKGQAAQA